LGVVFTVDGARAYLTQGRRPLRWVAWRNSLPETVQAFISW